MGRAGIGKQAGQQPSKTGITHPWCGVFRLGLRDLLLWDFLKIAAVSLLITFTKNLLLIKKLYSCQADRPNVVKIWCLSYSTNTLFF